ncbi:ATP-binding protein [bacterium]|nr:ATP-binding protein [bacterium]MBU1958029.1 ATP-binding protein [bacterium]
MELVYLWVEEYKNIYKQGFNFSPRFNCHYDGENLTVKENIDEDGNKQYIENFFGKNINVTAIVGKNGSGKSSISEMILPKVPHKRHNKYIIVAYNCNDDKYYSYDNVEFEILGSKKSHVKSSVEVSSSGVEIGAKENRDYNHNILYLNGLNFDFRTSTKYQYSDANDHIFIPKYINQYRKNLNLFKNKTFFYEFDKVRFILKEFNINDSIEDINQVQVLEKLTSMEKIELEENLGFSLSDDLFCQTLKRALIRFYLRQKDFKDKYQSEHIHKLFLINDCFEINKEDFSFIPKIDDILEALEYLKDKKLLEKVDIQNNLRIYFELNIEDTNLDKLWIFENFFDIPNFLGTKQENLPIFDLELYDSKKNMVYNLLSNGEKHYIRLIIEIISNRSGGDLNKQPKFYFFDEIETSLHPEWQKKIFCDINNIFRILDKNVHLIFLTHSPFLLSDIPKQNIVFLDTYKKEKTEKKYPKLKLPNDIKDGYCINVSKEINLNTFGQNIHTLLSDGFFMEDGLMGKFAKNKIQEIMNYLNNDKKLEDISTPQNQIKKVIESIGEDLLRRKLSDMYYEKFEKDELEREKQQLKEQQDEIIKRLESIEKRQNDTD